MPSPRSLRSAARQQQYKRTFEQTYVCDGCSPQRRSMSKISADVSCFPSRQTSLSPAAPTKMQCFDERLRQLPEPAPTVQNRLAPLNEYSDRTYLKYHHHKISDSSATDSNDSSPTTTISTVDDSSATEPSPGSSPESPPPSSYSPSTLRMHTTNDQRPFFELQKQPPPRKGRNLKGLAVNTMRPPERASSTTSLPLPATDASNMPSIASPSFIKPPTPPKRRPSNLGLTLLTPGSSKLPPQELRLGVPPTPGFGRPGTLRHFQSSPSLPLFPGLSSQAGGNSASPSERLGPLMETTSSPTQPKPQNLRETNIVEEEQNFDIPLSQEEKPVAYPDGPICVYDPHIDLYLEPTAEQARQYDVIMNVASEVRNPFLNHDQSGAEEPDIRIDGGGGIQYAPRRDRNDSGKGEIEQGHLVTPDTPQATTTEDKFRKDITPLESTQTPEYIHIKWEHNSDIVPDLLRLVKLIDDRVAQQKRILIHCQCGVSRSASLVVAYGLYKEPSLSVQEAYDAMKRRSKWIGPNMNLIMQLQEFRTSLTRGGLLSSDRGMSPITPSSAFMQWRSPFSAGAPPSAAPLPPRVEPPTQKPTGAPLSATSPGPSSAPSGLAWPLQEPKVVQRPRAISAAKTSTAYVDPAGYVVPVVPSVHVAQPYTASTIPLARQRSRSQLSTTESTSTTPTAPAKELVAEDFAMTPLRPSPAADPADTFGLMSPSSTEFATSPFDRSALLAQLGMGSAKPQEESVPRRSVSLRSKPQPPADQSLAPATDNRTSLRGKISTPNLREQQQLRGRRTSMETSRPQPSIHRPQLVKRDSIPDHALLSPRATEFTQNPFALALSSSVPSSEPLDAASATAPRTPPNADPRSPAQKGVSPITRSIMDVL